jgi:hypothetical protein
MDEEPGAFFIAKNLVFAAVIVWFCWLMASYKGLPNVLVVMFVLMLVLRLHDAPHDDRAPHLRAGRQREGGAALGHQGRSASRS